MIVINILRVTLVSTPLKSVMTEKLTPPHRFREKCDMFESRLKKMDDIFEIVQSSLRISSELRKDLSITEYLEVHCRYLLYLQVFHSILKNSEKYSQKMLIDAYYLALRYNFVVPRLYISYVISTLIRDTSYMENTIKMFQSVGHPLRGIRLRFTAAIFFPQNSDIIEKIAKENYNAMILLAGSFNQKYENEISYAAEWISSMVSLSLSHSDDVKNNLTEFFLYAALNCDIEPIATMTVKAVILSIDKDVLLIGNNIQLIAAYFAKFSENEICKSMAGNIFSLIPTEIGIKFLRASNCLRYYAETALNRLINEGDEKLINIVLKDFDNNQYVQIYALSKLGPEKYAALCGNLEKGSIITCKLLETYQPNMDPKQLRKCLSNEMEDRCIEIEVLLFKFFDVYSPPKEYYQIIFEKPFVFQNSEFLIFVVTKGKQLGVNVSEMKNWICDSKGIPSPNLTSAICFIEITPEEKFDFIASLNDETSITFFISHLKPEYGSELYLNVLSKCTTAKLASHLVCAAASAGFNRIVEEGFIKILEADGDFYLMRNRMSIYFELALNTVYAISAEKLMISNELFNNFLLTVLKILSNVLQAGYPIATQDKIEHWIKIIQFGKKLSTLSIFHAQIAELISVLQKFLE